MTTEEYSNKIGSLYEPLYKLIENIHFQNHIIDSYQFGALVCSLPDIQEISKTELIEKDQEIITTFFSTLEKESGSESPFLHTQATINLYTFLEAGIKNLIINFLKFRHRADQVETEIKVPFFQFTNLEKDEQYDFLFEQFEKTTAAGLKYGVTRFETLLQPFGFSGSVPKPVSDGIYELAQIRNNLLHKSGITDKQLLNSCPWLPFKIGDKISIKNAEYIKFRSLVLEYVTILAQRIKNKEFPLDEYLKK